MRRAKHTLPGFTIVELLIVVVVIAILAAITIVSFNGIQERAATTKRDADMATLLKAIIAARNNTNQTLGQITGTHWSIGNCASNGSNPDGIEPRDLPTSHSCWGRYYNNLTVIGQAAGMDLSGLRSGDARGNPYMFDENEGENGNFCSSDSAIRYYRGSGVLNSDGPPIPKFFASC